MNFDTKNFEKHIPYYLTAQDKHVLLANLEAISQGGSAQYVLDEYYDDFRKEMLQGDGWKKCQLYNFDNKKIHSVFGIVLSNSCDIDESNARDYPIRVTFSPLVKLRNFEKVMKDNGIDERKLQEKLDAIKNQKVTNVFFIPANGPLKDDYIVKLDDIHSVSLQYLKDCEKIEKNFTLSNTGFYMLLFKLSIHFCRIQENINRD